mmetsp:Transcript_28620/g.77209  ORF Transcript_28620/g.77209 Transcript_28620/m.77209 type:complete len:543 (+) Transcript_28620:48-1676(+)|eukprot:CAMPEP_0202338778 /NCGR_PEP_ID=MMETSP1126-20121109/916_1 /ASSEMBLY_ACC=CAM_ASM_000457 /TAXON_ID=3047 /ORGANISM="Dunaliella tertiolecta, Strain CCMP1320" /LENGTH=542 /DNA_ID=CAMNT_0048929221 /DNA_START=20 /DNA_END=1648 /DNA_ORIENTATION=-
MASGNVTAERQPDATRPKEAKNAWLFGCEDLADVKLQLYSTRPDGQEGPQEDELALHAVVLAANSIYFRTKLLANKSGGVLRILREQLASSEEVQAARIVLSHMYKEVLEHNGISQLVTALKLADRWQADDTIAACSSAFAALDPKDIDLDALKRAYSVEGILHNTASFSEMIPKVQGRLMDMFSDLVQVMRSPEMQSQLLQLPFAAVLVLLRSEQLVVDSENTVLAVANLWVTRGQGKGSTDHQKEMLANTVRLHALSTSYICGVLPNLKWFAWPKQAPGAYYGTLQARMMSKEAAQVLAVHSRPGGAGAAAVYTPGDQAQSRRVNDQNLELICDIEEDRLNQYIRDGTAGLQAAQSQGGGFYKGIHVHSECSYFSGFLWGIKVVFGFSAGGPSSSNAATKTGVEGEMQAMSLKAGDGSVHGGLANGEAKTSAVPQFTVTPSVFAALPPGEEGIAPIYTPINTTFRCTLEAIGDYNTPYSAATFLGASFMRPGDDSVSSIGISNFFKKVGAQQGEPEAWKPFLHGGNKLRLKLHVAGNSVE